MWSSRLLERLLLTDEYLLLRLEAPGGLDFRPGMFVNLQLPGDRFSLPRPFSVMSATDGSLQLLVKVVGRETRRFRDCPADSVFSLAGPLGTPFPVPAGALLLVGGGVGLAPLLFLAQQYRDRVTLLAGFRTAAEYESLAAVLPPLSQALLATDDGSAGSPGLVTELLEQHLAAGGCDYAAAMVCGPEPMMYRVAQLLRSLPTWVSLENYMACGYGVCMGCVVAMSDRNLSRACCEGPVFRSDLLQGYGSDNG
ncbi:MAG: dihydroorotate dehydrogenase electron transfer subunit [Candidatus Delongbacteria bacterium]|nr:dihydroorotate dehydrogenase electron transfer subunit [Candidatus Delongbacteria bacterium]